MRINWFSPCWAPFDGYGNSAVHMIRALESLGHEVGILNVGSLHTRGGFDLSFFDKRPALKSSDATICYTLPPDFKAFTRRGLYGFSMWENDTPPFDWIEGLAWPQELWAPSRSSAAAFQPYIGSEVRVVPLGVDPAEFPVQFRRRRDSLRFLHMASTHGMWRKGADIAIEAFRQAFFDSDNVELVIHAAEGAQPTSDDPRIKYETSEIALADLPAYFHSFDALLYTSRGEGYGLIALEAACTGMLVIHTGMTGMAEYEEIGTVVPCHRIVRDGATWYEMDINLLSMRLIQVAKNHHGFMAMAERDAREVRKSHTWDRSARAIIDRLSQTLARV